MAHLIDKDALVAEIEKCYNECLKRAKIIDSDYWNAKADAYRNVLALLYDTLEVKEVDLEKEMDFVKDAYYYFTSDEKDSMMKVARHFFELGLKAQKGE